MSLTKEMLAQIGHIVRPIANRAVNMVARGVVSLVDDSAKMQLLQIGVLAGETLDGAEHFQPYGFSSVPLAGAEHVTVFASGDRGHPLVIQVADRRYRPTGGDPGEVGLHNHVPGCRVILTADGDIEIQPAAGQHVFIREAGGTVDRLVKKSEHDGHTHAAGTLTAPSGGGSVTGDTAGAASVTGTETLRVQ